MKFSFDSFMLLHSNLEKNICNDLLFKTKLLSFQDSSKDSRDKEKGGVGASITAKLTVQLGERLNAEEPNLHLWGVVLCHLGVL